MAGKMKSQWDFGELFSEEEVRQVLTVTELTAKVKRVFERELGEVWVIGEISNLREPASGHMYFAIKDGGAQLNCVLFRGQRVTNRSMLEDGQEVVLRGDLTVYEARGQYQLIVAEVELKGVGALQVAFEKLKRKLEAEGLFDPAHKRELPAYPRRIGIVTSSTAAALRDVLHVIERRDPGLELILSPCRVQGEGAALEIARAIGRLNEWNARHSGDPSKRIDLILVTRGGGSLEDLWAFNEEPAARALAASALPTISGVGHEIDFTIVDFVADVRAATPSAAAEIVTASIWASREFVAEAGDLLRRRARWWIGAKREALAMQRLQLVRTHPLRRLRERMQRLDDLSEALRRNFRFRLRERTADWHSLAGRLARVPLRQPVDQARKRLEEIQARLKGCAEFGLQRARQKLNLAGASLKFLSPEHVLQRGYSITTDAGTGDIVRSSGAVRKGQRLKTRLAAGEIESRVENAGER